MERQRIVVDEPTELPDGTELELVEASGVGALSDSDRDELAFRFAQIRSGESISADDLFTHLAAKRCQ